MTNEERLVLFLSRITFEDRVADQIEAVLKGSISWDAVYRLSLLHGVASLLYHNFKKLKLNIPHEIIKKFEASYFATLAQNIRFHNELGQILGGVVKEGAEPIVLKGIPLCHYLYGNLGLRPSVDIDLLFKFNDIIRLSRFFESMGYEGTDEDPQELRRCHWFKRGLVKRVGFPVFLDVQWNWAQSTRARPDMGLAWGRSQIILLDGLPVRLLSLEDMLLYLCTHLSNHSFILRLIWVCDIHEIICQKGLTLDWAYIFREASRQRLQTPLFVTLNYMRRVYGSNIPTRVLKKIKISKLRSGYLNAFLNQNTLRYFRYPMNFWKQHMFRLFLIDKPLDRIIFCFDVLKRHHIRR